ncbi:hypothetical protein N7455_002045 [Penicillium solitum]|uniref:uncharacterized protein n=1 Tax=Penicillium solitum TaxID=60172 RepID=UPI0032C49725|nr:hypothetical protein N7455_002045 [Penicillium solitum]
MVVKIFLSLLHFFHTLSLLALVPEGAYSLALSKINYDSPLGLRYSDSSGQSYIHLPNWGGGVQMWGQLRENIKHGIYLTFENHSFDNIAGYWDFHPEIDNLRNLTYCNDYTNPNWTVYGEPLAICAELGTRQKRMSPTGGFIERQSERYNATPGDSAFVIKALNQKKTATLVELASNFTFFDSYFAEHPGPTNPNRQFATSGSSCGSVDNTDQSAGLWNNVTGTTCAVSIFESLSKKNISWKNSVTPYTHPSVSSVASNDIKWVQDNAMDRLVHATELYHDLETGTLPSFSYLNPECCTVDSIHPTSSVAAGEQMLHYPHAECGNSEHGGFSDHVPTPVNVPQPEDGISSGAGHQTTILHTTLHAWESGMHLTPNLSFATVPDFIISPWVPANLLIHDQGTIYADNSTYTHGSILHFLQELWGLEGLNNRVQWAKTFETVFTKKRPNDTPKTLVKPTWYGGSGQPEPEPFFLLNQDESYYACRRPRLRLRYKG